MNRSDDLRIEVIRKSDKKSVLEVSTYVSNEFTTQYCSKEEKIKKIEGQIRKGKSKAFSITLNKVSVGTIIANIFDRKEIENQLYLSVENGIVSLVSLGDIIRSKKYKLPEKLIELAYIIVLPQYRNLGIGALAWDAYEEYIKDTFPGAGKFILIRPADYKLINYPKVLSYLLNKERAAQNVPEDEYVFVRGVQTPVDELFAHLGEEVDLAYDRGVPAMTHMAIEKEYAPIGFSKSFCPVWFKN